MYAVVAAVVAAVSAFSPLPLERLQAEPPLDGRRPLQARISPAGRFVTFLKPSPDNAEVLDLWAQPLPSGAPALLVSTSQLLAGKAQKLSEAEKMALERQRISQRGITSYSWCGTDDRRLLFPLSGDLYVATLADGQPPQVTRLTRDDAVPEQNPTCRTDGSAVAYVKSGNVVVHDLKKNTTRAITSGASDTHFFGLAEFIADEELSRHDGMWWSRDGKKLLVLEVDESGVGIKTRPQIFADHTEMVSQRYPAAGEKNAVVNARIVDAASGKTTKITLPANVEYIARGGFFHDGVAWLQLLDRAQTALTLVEVDGKTGKTRTITTDVDAAWVEVHDDLDELGADLKQGLLWSSERSGRKQLERLDRAAGTTTALTTMPEAVDSLVCVDVDADRIVFSAFADRGRAHHLYAREKDGSIRALTSGKSSSSATGDKRCQHLLVTTSSWGTPPVTTMIAVKDGATLGTVGDEGPDPLLADSVPAPPRFLDVLAADGTTVLNGLWLPPAPTSSTPPAGTLAQAMRTVPKKGSVPVIAYAYGGPTGQVVSYRWAKLQPLFTHWQQLGFGVFLVDTRGMAGRDRSFTRAHKSAFGKVEVDDLTAALRQLPSLVPAVDPKRIGFFGWSYGGFLAARSVLDADTPVAAAAAVAPVTDWRLYDTAYTERYLGLPSTSAEAYSAANLVSRAAWLSKPLLLVHGTADDNVLFEHSLQLIAALQNEAKVFDLAIYPGKAHGIAGKSSQLHLHKTLTQFFVDQLHPTPVKP
jgi:dipeptidyl-peptidase-4